MRNAYEIYGYTVFYLSDKWYGKGRVSRFVVYRQIMVCVHKHTKAHAQAYIFMYVHVYMYNLEGEIEIYIPIWKCKFMWLKINK